MTDNSIKPMCPTCKIKNIIYLVTRRVLYWWKWGCFTTILGFFPWEVKNIIFAWRGACEVASTHVRWDRNEYQKWTFGGGKGDGVRQEQEQNGVEPVGSRGQMDRWGGARQDWGQIGTSSGTRQGNIGRPDGMGVDGSYLVAYPCLVPHPLCGIPSHMWYPILPLWYPIPPSGIPSHLSSLSGTPSLYLVTHHPYLVPPSPYLVQHPLYVLIPVWYPILDRSTQRVTKV